MIDDTQTPCLLVAMPNLSDPYFAHSVILLCEYTSDTAFGVVVNRPTDIGLRDLLEGDPDILGSTDATFHVGGPVQADFMWALHTPGLDGSSTTQLSERLSMSSVQELLVNLHEGKVPERYIMGFGYAGWGPGQLTEEIGQGSWWTAPLDADLVLEAPDEERWPRLIHRLGLDPASVHFGSVGEA